MRRILDFRHGTFQATRFYGMFVTGDGGSGKIGRLEQDIGQVIAEGDSVVYVKLYPEAPASFISIAACALWHREERRAVPTMSSGTPPACALASPSDEDVVGNVVPGIMNADEE